jgi:hydroxypyruvate reductase
MIIHPDQITTYSLRRSTSGEDICRILAAAINGADAGEAVKKHVTRDSDYLIIDTVNYNLSKFNRIYVIGAGKASIPMTNAIYEILNDQIISGLVITKDGYLDSDKYHIGTQVKIIEASHPIPDQRNLDSALKLITLTSELNIDDLVIFLLSGGGSSLLMNPLPGISLQDIQDITAILLSCGVSITEMNTIRKHMDAFKGGGLVKFLTPATVISLLLSDVVGDNLEVIASGPTVADPSTFDDAWAILNKYEILDLIPINIKSKISAGIQGEIQETVKLGDPILNKVSNFIVGNNSDALSSAITTAKQLGFATRVFTTQLQGEASQMGKLLSEEAKSWISPPCSVTVPACLIAGGETTVSINGTGKGGRNQELALGAAKSLSGSQQFLLASLATDGGDGPTDAAGAISTNETISRGLAMGLDINDYLRRNDSYHYFESLGDLIKTGPTLTNVNDLVFIFCL